MAGLSRADMTGGKPTPQLEHCYTSVAFSLKEMTHLQHGVLNWDSHYVGRIELLSKTKFHFWEQPLPRDIHLFLDRNRDLTRIPGSHKPRPRGASANHLPWAGLFWIWLAEDSLGGAKKSREEVNECSIPQNCSGEFNVLKLFVLQSSVWLSLTLFWW